MVRLLVPRIALTPSWPSFSVSGMEPRIALTPSWLSPSISGMEPQIASTLSFSSISGIEPFPELSHIRNRATSGLEPFPEWSHGLLWRLFGFILHLHFLARPEIPRNKIYFFRIFFEVFGLRFYNTNIISATLKWETHHDASDKMRNFYHPLKN